MTKKNNCISQNKTTFPDLFKDYGDSSVKCSVDMTKNGCESSDDYNVLDTQPMENTSNGINGIQSQGCISSELDNISRCDILSSQSNQGCPYINNAGSNRKQSTKCDNENQYNKGEQGGGGLTGDTGCKGEKGDRGCRGYQGEPGHKGCVGEKGPRGHSLKGDKGSTGMCGDTDYNGEKGQRGDTGCKGDEGCKGDRGNNGFHGLRGPPGCDGVSGEKGDHGCRGPKGDKGTHGCDGLKGEPGTAPILDLLCKQLSCSKGEKGCQGSTDGIIIGYSELDSVTQSFSYKLTNIVEPIKFIGDTNNMQVMYQVTAVIPKSKKLLIEFNTIWIPDSPNWTDLYVKLSLSTSSGTHTPVSVNGNNQDIYYRKYEWVKTDSNPSIKFLNPIFYIDYNINGVNIPEGNTVTFYLSASTGVSTPQQHSKLIFGNNSTTNICWAHSFARITDLGVSHGYIPDLEC